MVYTKQKPKTVWYIPKQDLLAVLDDDVFFGPRLVTESRGKEIELVITYNGEWWPMGPASLSKAGAELLGEL